MARHFISSVLQQQFHFVAELSFLLRSFYIINKSTSVKPLILAFLYVNFEPSLYAIERIFIFVKYFTNF